MMKFEQREKAEELLERAEQKAQSYPDHADVLIRIAFVYAYMGKE
jgi:hypothetical protein